MTGIDTLSKSYVSTPLTPPPSFSTTLLFNSDVTRNRSRLSPLHFELQLDYLSVWQYTWKQQSLTPKGACNSINIIDNVWHEIIPLCDLNQLEFLQTVTTPIAHRAFSFSAVSKSASSLTSPVNTLGTLSDIHFQTILERSLQYESEFLKSIPENRRKRYCQIPKWVEYVKNRQKHVNSITPISEIKYPPKLPPLNPPRPVIQSCSSGSKSVRCQVSEYNNKMDIRSPPISRRHMSSSSLRSITSTCPNNMSDRYIVTSPQKESFISTENVFNSVKIFKSWFYDWDHFERQTCLCFLLLLLSPTELYYLRKSIINALCRDIISIVSEDIYAKILSCVGFRDLCHLSTVSKAWKVRTASNLVWINKLKWDLFIPKLTSLTKGLPYKGIYKYVYLTRKNWLHRKYSTSNIISHDCKVLSVKRNDKFIATGAIDGSIKLWHAKMLSLCATLYGHLKGVWCLTFTHDGSFLISGSYDCFIRVWKLNDYSLERILSLHTGPVWCLVSRQDVLLSTSHDRTARLWDLNSFTPLKIYIGHKKGIFAADIDNSLQLVVTGSSDRIVRVWNANTTNCINQIKISLLHPVISVQCIEQCYVVCCTFNKILVWNINTSTKMTIIDDDEKRIESMRVFMFSSALNRDGIIVTGSQSKLIKLYNFKTGSLIGTFRGHKSAITDIDIEYNELVSVGNDGRLNRWDFRPVKFKY